MKTPVFNISRSILLFSCLILFLFPMAKGQAPSPSTESQIDDVLKRLDQGQSIENVVIDLRDILFEFDSPALQASTKPYLDKVVLLMKRVPNMTVEISGHTDNVGNADYNKKLSGQRAEAVRQYLIDGGISTERISAQGLGADTPLVSNDTKEGRAQNRRVELKIMKPATVETLQDLIVLANGDTLGGTVLFADGEKIVYRSFQSDEEITLAATEVRKILYANGRVWFVPVVVAEPTPAPKEENKSPGDWWRNVKDEFPFLQAPETFQPGSATWMVSSELVSNLASDPLPYRTNSFPALSVTYEKAKWDAIGLGYTLAARWWGDPTLAYNFVYGSAGVRLTYHFNIHPKLDPYVGLALTYRRVQFWNQDYLESQGSIGFNGLIGARFFLTPHFGAGLEAGSDAIAKFRAGVCYRFD